MCRGNGRESNPPPQIHSLPSSQTSTVTIRFKYPPFLSTSVPKSRRGKVRKGKLKDALVS